MLSKVSSASFAATFVVVAASLMTIIVATATRSPEMMVLPLLGAAISTLLMAVGVGIELWESFS